MTDHEAVKDTVLNYYEGYLHKDRFRLEKAFALEVANMQGYIEKDQGKRVLFSMTMSDAINEWTASDYVPFKCTQGTILNLTFFGDVGAVVLFDFGGKYLESLQLAKTDTGWQIVNKYIVNHKK